VIIDPPKPRIELEEVAAPRLAAEQPLVVIPPPPSAAPPATSLALSGVLVLGVGLGALETVNFIIDEFARSELLGGLTLAVAVAGFGLIGGGIWRELRGLFGLNRVDHLRQDLQSGDVARARAAATAWLARLPEGAAILPAIEAAHDTAAIAALLRAGPLAGLRTRTDALGRAAAVQTFAATAVVPSPLFDGLLVGWRGIRLVRQVAALHGLRPGLFATMSLLRRTAFSAATVVTTDVAVSTALGAITSHPLLRHVAGDMAGAGVAARRLFLLARAAAAACSPVDPNG